MLRALVGASLVAGSLLASSPARADEVIGAPPPKELTLEDGMRVPAGYTVVERTRKGPIIAGAITFGTSYLVAVATGVSAHLYNDSNSAVPFVIPVLGPFIQMDRPGADLSTLLLATNGIAQGLGAGLLFYGLVAKKQVLLRDDLVVAPMLSGSAAGMSVAGTF